MANVVFDFDGTLADTFPLVIDVAYKLSPGTRRISPEAITRLRRLPLLTALRELGIPNRHMPLLILFTRKRLAERMQEVRPYEGVEAMVRSLHAAGSQLFILTSNYRENVQDFLEHYKLETFFSDVETVYYANSLTKTRALRRLLRRHGLHAAETYHVGNEALDIRAARRVGMPAVAVAWGGYDVRALKAAKPLAIVETPRQLVGLLPHSP